MPIEKIWVIIGFITIMSLLFWRMKIAWNKIGITMAKEAEEREAEKEAEKLAKESAKSAEVKPEEPPKKE